MPDRIKTLNGEIASTYLHAGCLSASRSSRIRPGKAWLVCLAAAVSLAALLLLPACMNSGQAAATTRQETTVSGSGIAEKQAGTKGGNLHYQNLVLGIGDLICYNTAAGQICMSGPDGSGSVVLAELAGSNFTSDGRSLFFTEGLQSGNLWKIDLDGTNQVRIGNTSLKYLISADDRLFAIEGNAGRPVSLKQDGTGRFLLADFPAAALTLFKSTLYISGAGDATGVIAIDLATNRQEILFNRHVSSLNAGSEWLYYADPADHYQVYAWSIQEKAGRKISRLSLEKPFIVSCGYLYFIFQTEQNRLYRLPVQGQQNLDSLAPELIVDDAVGAFAVLGDCIYYQRPDSRRIYLVPLTGGKAQRIT